MRACGSAALEEVAARGSRLAVLAVAGVHARCRSRDLPVQVARPAGSGRVQSRPAPFLHSRDSEHSQPRPTRRDLLKRRAPAGAHRPASRAQIWRAAHDPGARTARREAWRARPCRPWLRAPEAPERRHGCPCSNNNTGTPT